MAKYTVSDGRLVLTLVEAEEGGFCVTAPMHPGVTTQAETLSEAFVMARDAIRGLRAGRKHLDAEWREFLRLRHRPIRRKRSRG